MVPTWEYRGQEVPEDVDVSVEVDVSGVFGFFALSSDIAGVATARNTMAGKLVRTASIAVDGLLDPVREG
jgi:hypothetical protein